MKENILNLEGMKALADRLSKIPEITRRNEGDDIEAVTLAHAFLDLEESFRKYLDHLLPRLVKEQLSDAEIIDLLGDIGEDFRHILYHIKDPKFYRYLQKEEG